MAIEGTGVVCPRVWEKVLQAVVRQAKEMSDGLPTDDAILARCWIEGRSGAAATKGELEHSFEKACLARGVDVKVWRVKLVAEIDQAWQTAAMQHLSESNYVRRAMVLTCAGVPTSIGRQYVLPLVSKRDYEDVAGIDHGDKFAMYDRRESGVYRR